MIMNLCLARVQPTPGACKDSIAQFFGKVYNYFFVDLCKIFSSPEKRGNRQEKWPGYFLKSSCTFLLEMV